MDESGELLPPNLNCARFLATFAHKKSIKERVRRSSLKNNPKRLTVIMLHQIIDNKNKESIG